MTDLPPVDDPTAPIEAVGAVHDEARGKRAMPWMPILTGIGGIVIAGLVIVIVLLLGRGTSPVALPTSTPSATASPVPTSTPRSTPTPTPGPTAVVAAPAPVVPAPANPPAADPAPANPPPPEKTPITAGIVSFDAHVEGSATIASACYAVRDKAAGDNSWVLLRFSWVTRGLIDGGEIQVNGTYGGSGDLQGLEANSSVLFDLKCFNTDGSVKSTSYTLLMSDGTTRYTRTITITGAG